MKRPLAIIGLLANLSCITVPPPRSPGTVPELAAGFGTPSGYTSTSAEQSLAAGRAALRQRHYAKAIYLLDDASTRFPRDRRVQVELGRAYLYDHQEYRAMRLFREVLREDPSNRPAKLELARVLGYHRHYDASNQLYKELLKANPNDEPASLGLIRNLIYEHQTEEARRELDQALARHPNSPRLRNVKARLEKESEKPSARGQARPEQTANKP
jgi:tetratricopeptide (TPR) repeat protein